MATLQEKQSIWNKYRNIVADFKCEGPFTKDQHLFAIIKHPTIKYRFHNIPRTDGNYYYIVGTDEEQRLFSKFIKRLDGSDQFVGGKMALLKEYADESILAQGLIHVSGNDVVFSVDREYMSSLDIADIRGFFEIVELAFEEILPNRNITHSFDLKQFKGPVGIPDYNYSSQDDSIRVMLKRKEAYKYFRRIIWTENSSERNQKYDAYVNVGASCVDKNPDAVNGKVSLEVGEIDLYIAEKWRKTLGVVSVNEPLPTNHKLPVKSYFNLESRMIYLSTGQQVKVESTIAESNNVVYKCNGGKILKVVHLVMPFNSISNAKQIEIEDQFYKAQKPDSDDILAFQIPGICAVGYLMPDMGECIMNIPYSVRSTMYSKFKRQYLKLFMKFVIRGNNGQYISTYNDVKPDNTTYIVNSNNEYVFYLVDIDSRAYTNMYYGDPSKKSLKNQLFGVVMVLDWFKEDREPFGDKHYKYYEKEQWVRKNLKGDLAEFMGAILDEKNTSEDLVKYVSAYI
jgi:hypothetical protein